MPEFDFFVLDATGPYTRKSECDEAERKSDITGGEKRTGSLKVSEDAVDDSEVSAERMNQGKAIPIEMDHDHQNADRTHELHDLNQSAQVVFVLHNR